MSKANANTTKSVTNDLEVEVLYQKLGDRWFAFSIVNDEVFMSPVSDDQIAVAKKDPSAQPRDYNEDFDNNDNDGKNNNETV